MSDPTSAPGAPTEQLEPRLYRLADVLGELRREADAAHEARTTGTPRGQKRP